MLVASCRRKAGADLPPPPKTAIPGPEYFGLTHSSIMPLIEALDLEHKCAAYWMGKQVTCGITCCASGCMDFIATSGQ